ncbi:MAG: filamentous hemagglutinin N-terminal domain-containing protein [Rivularia sp. T60_A2020_040]|nr:filamentous hemagglutinin N-terminal domain-containing protein [Rivularia sp. T60_A2020_040]
MKLKYLLTLFLISSVPQAQAQITPTSNDANTIVNQTGNTFTITGGTQVDKNLFHSLQKFGLNESQIADFVTNPGTQNVLGRITGGDASVINGLIKITGSDANLYLMNPAGIIFGSGARLDVPGSFTATTANGIGFGDNKWFNAFGTNNYAELIGEPNSFAFTMSQPGAIFNAGNLAVAKGESLNLLGGITINTGTLSSEGGNINVAAIPGQKLVRITQEGSLLSLGLPTSTANNLNPVSFNPLSLPQLLTGGNLNSATGITVENGIVKLTGSGVEIPNQSGTAIVSNKINTSGNIGGNINILGEKVGIINANINASGENGGGTVLIGGDYKGEGIVPNAKRTFISRDSVIKADAEDSGNGGKVIAWADQNTGFYGTISARGGKVSGDGGFVEVSGKENLAFDGFVDAGASFGQGGKLLLDPDDVFIGDISTDNARLRDTGDNQGIINANIFSFDFFISADRVVDVLNSTDVSIGAQNLIRVEKEIDASGNSRTSNLILTGRKIEVFAPIKLNGGDINLNASTTDINVNAPLISNGGNVNLSSPLINLEQPSDIDKLIASNGGDITFNGAVSLDSSKFVFGRRTTFIESIKPGERAGNIIFNNTVDSDSFSGVQSLNLNARAFGSENENTMSGNVKILGFLGSSEPLGTLDIRGRDIELAELNVSSFNVGRANNINIKAPGSDLNFRFFQLNADEDISVEAQNLIIDNFNQIDSRNVKLEAENITIRRTTGSSPSILARRNLDIEAQGSLTLDGVNLNSENGALKLTSQNNVLIQDSQLQADGDIKLESVSGNLTLLGTELSSTKNIELQTPNQVQLSETSGDSGRPFITEAKENITIVGNGGIEITAFENPESILRSGGNFSLISDNNIIGNARISSGGNLSAGSGSFSQPALSLNGIISSNGDVSFDDYTGSSLKVEAKGSIRGGNINITNIGTFPQTGDSDIAILNAQPALILRAGVTELANSPRIGDIGGTSFTSTENPSLPANIQIGNIETGGIVNLSSTNGSITTGNINVGSLDISSKGDIDTKRITTRRLFDSEYTPTGNVNLTSNSGKIVVDFINASSSQDLQGNVTIKAEDVFQARSFFPKTFTSRLSNAPTSIASSGKISIEHRGESFTEGIGLEKDTNGNIVYRISAPGEDIDGTRVFLKEDSDFNSRFVFEDGTVVNENVSILTIPFNIDDISENLSYTAGAIFISGGSNEALYGAFQDTELRNSSDINVVGIPKPIQPNPDGEIVQRQLNQDEKNSICPPQSTVAFNQGKNTRGGQTTTISQPPNKDACTTVNKENILKVAQ